MFSQSVMGVARAAQALSNPAATCTKTVRIAICSAPQHKTHERRHSSSKAPSSKAPCPPGGPSGPSGPEQPTNNAATTPAEEQKRPSRSMTRRRSRDTTAETALKARDDAFANMPAVPSTHHLPPTGSSAQLHACVRLMQKLMELNWILELALSSFFSLHRPISITTPLPNPTSTTSFNAIFDVRPSHKYNDTIYTLNSAVSILEGANTGSQSVEEKDLRREILHQSTSHNGNISFHDFSMTQNLDQLAKKFRPFNVPPAPVPFNAAFESEREREREREALKRQREEETTHTKTFTTTLTINENTDGAGHKTYTASAGPIVELSRPREAFATRMRIRAGHLAEERKRKGGKVWAISVKRQRKLKMKKHKYKKLMKRTRNLRRREGRT